MELSQARLPVSSCARAICRRPGAPARAAPSIGPSRAPDPLRTPTSLPISRRGDAAEREADNAAGRVVRGGRAHIAAAPPAPARKCAACEEQDREAGAEVRRKPAGEAAPAEQAPPAVAAALAAPGRPLDAAARAYFEPRFGASFAGVRIHNDGAAATAARSIDARAFTLGRRIGFAAGAYAPGTHAGRHLLAHELAHVVQHGGRAPVIARSPDSLSEEEALKLANESPIEISGRGFHQFDELFRAAKAGWVDVVTPAELERQIRFRISRGGREFIDSWTQDQLWDYHLADPAEQEGMMQARWDSFIRTTYFRLLGSKARQWDKATRRMATAAFLGNVIGGVTVAAGGFFAGAGLGLGASGAAAEGAVAREVAKTVLKREVEAVARNRLGEASMKAAEMAVKAVQALSALKDQDDGDDEKDECETSFGLRPGIDARFIEQRPPIGGQTTVFLARFRLDAGRKPPEGQKTNENSRAWVRAIGCPPDQAGHVIARRFGGRNDFNAQNGNVFPEDSEFNNEQMNAMDGLVQRTHRSGSDMCVLILLSYEPANSLRPTHATYSAMERRPGSKHFVSWQTSLIRNESRDPNCTA